MRPIQVAVDLAGPVGDDGLDGLLALGGDHRDAADDAGDPHRPRGGGPTPMRTVPRDARGPLEGLVGQALLVGLGEPAAEPAEPTADPAEQAHPSSASEAAPGRRACGPRRRLRERACATAGFLAARAGLRAAGFLAVAVLARDRGSADVLGLLLDGLADGGRLLGLLRLDHELGLARLRDVDRARQDRRAARGDRQAAAGVVAMLTTTGAISSATRFMTLISGLRAGPAVSLNGSPTVSPMTVALCDSEPLPP